MENITLQNKRMEREMNKFNEKNVLITGGSGMIGRELVDLLYEQGAKIFVADLHKPPEDDKIYKKILYFFGQDLRLFSSCITVCQNMDYVFNVVGIKGSPKMTSEQPADFMIPMMQFNTNMMEAARICNVKWYLYTSSVGVYHPAPLLKEDDVWKTFPSENDKFAGWAKRIGELQAEAYNIQYGTNNISIVRPANVYGNYDNFDVDNAMVIPSLIRKAHENEVLEVWGDGSPIRDFIHAKDVARGMIHVVENEITTPINLGSGVGVSIKTIANIISNEFGKDIKWIIDKPSGDNKRILDTNRAKSYGFEPEIMITNGISDTIQWFLNNKNVIDERFNAFK